MNTSVTCAPIGERAVCYAHTAKGIPSDQVHHIHAEGEEVASYPGHMGGELGSIATAKKEADCFSVAVLTQLQYSFVIHSCNIHLLLHACARNLKSWNSTNIQVSLG